MLDLLSTKRKSLFKCSFGNWSTYNGFERWLRGSFIRVSLSSFTELPEFITKPESQTVTAGEDVFLECQARGEPHPDMVWTRRGQAIDAGRVEVVHGKGVRIAGAAAADEGEYVCTAANSAGSVAAAAQLRVVEPARIAVRPEASLQVVAGGGKNVSLECAAEGRPAPVVFWTKEEQDRTVLMRPGSAHGRLSVSDSGTLMVSAPRPEEDSGHYTCAATNEAGSDVARSHLLVYDPADFQEEAGTFAGHSEMYHRELSRGLEAQGARQALSRLRVKFESAYAVGPTSVRLSWKRVGKKAAADLDGYRIWYRPEEEDADFREIAVPHPDVSTFVVTRLREFTRYLFFVQPFSGPVPGAPSPLASARTHADAPSAAPAVTEARLVNASTIFLAWDGLGEEESNGPLTGYEVGLPNFNMRCHKVAPRRVQQLCCVPFQAPPDPPETEKRVFFPFHLRPPL